ncbi:MAG TPA: NTP transferase domain-containing protein, partial [Rhizomicrobium sp.]
MNRPTAPDASCLAIVLAAGAGTRMRSSTPKVLHSVGGRTLIAHVLNAASRAGGAKIAVVVGPGRDDVAAEARKIAPQAEIFEQRERLGTAHAVLAARKAIESGAGDILVMFADTPLVRAETLTALRAALHAGAAVAVLGFTPKDPAGYGRLVMQGDELTAIVEEKDATAQQRAIGFCNGGLMALSGAHALTLLDRIGNANSKG